MTDAGTTPAGDRWPGARQHPRTYPGAHPTGSFALLDDTVQPLSLQPGSPADGGLSTASLEALLAAGGLPALTNRVPVLAYGGNRNPGTLLLKLAHYRYRSPGKGLVLPVLRAELQGFDVVAGGLSAQGYVYADLLADPDLTAEVLSVHVLLLDAEQLRVLHDSEGVRSGYYAAARVPGVLVDGFETAINAVGYVGRRPVWRSPRHGSPVALAAVQARGRRLPQYENPDLLAHVLSTLDLAGPVQAVVCPGVGGNSPCDTTQLADGLMKYLNGQWWYRQHTGEQRLRACEDLETLIVDRMRETAHPGPAPAELLAAEGRLLSTEEAYQLQPEWLE